MSEATRVQALVVSHDKMCFACGERPAEVAFTYRVPLHRVIDRTRSGGYSYTETTKYETTAVDVPLCPNCSSNRKTVNSRVRWGTVAYVPLAFLVSGIAFLINPFLGTPVALLAIVGWFRLRPHIVRTRHAERLQPEAHPGVARLIEDGWILGEAPGSWKPV